MLSVWSGQCVLGKQPLCNVNVSPNAHSPRLALANDGLWLAIMFMSFLIRESKETNRYILMRIEFFVNSCIMYLQTFRYSNIYAERYFALGLFNQTRYNIQLKIYIYIHFQRLKKIVG